MRKIDIDILEIIQVKTIERESTVRHSLKLVEHHATVDSVTVSHMQLHRPMLTRIIDILGINLCIQLFFRKVKTYLRSYPQKSSVVEQFVVFVRLPVGYTVAVTVAEEQRVYDGRTVYTTHFREVDIIGIDKRIAHLSEEDLTFGLIQIVNRILYLFLPVYNLPLHFVLIHKFFLFRKRERTHFSKRIHISHEPAGVAPQSV